MHRELRILKTFPAKHRNNSLGWEYEVTEWASTPGLTPVFEGAAEERWVCLLSVLDSSPRGRVNHVGVSQQSVVITPVFSALPMFAGQINFVRKNLCDRLGKAVAEPPPQNSGKRRGKL
uniref:Uncharacterized protein n=1 Tax=Globodera rostochiensis TaxID=31243 RepID=A0A914HC96_GLORO